MPGSKTKEKVDKHQPKLGVSASGNMVKASTPSSTASGGTAGDDVIGQVIPLWVRAKPNHWNEDERTPGERLLEYVVYPNREGPLTADASMLLVPVKGVVVDGKVPGGCYRCVYMQDTRGGTVRPGLDEEGDESKGAPVAAKEPPPVRLWELCDVCDMELQQALAGRPHLEWAAVANVLAYERRQVEAIAIREGDKSILAAREAKKRRKERFVWASEPHVPTCLMPQAVAAWGLETSVAEWRDKPETTEIDAAGEDAVPMEESK